MILLLGMSSCYPPRIVYALDDIHSVKNDSIDVQLLKGSTISLDARDLTSILRIEIWNKGNSTLTLNKNNELEARIDSVTLNYELKDRDSDPFPCILEPISQKKISLVFKAEDLNYHLYRSLNNKNGHFLKLHLSFQNSSGKEIDKEIILKYVKTRRLKYEKDDEKE